MSDLGEKVKASIERLKGFVPEEGYYLAFSGGKDSVVCKALLEMSGVKFDATYRVTSVDPPELVRFIREKHPDVKMDIPHYADGSPITMWNLIQRKLMPPTRIARYCCEYLKESGGDGRKTVTGVRWEESTNRAKNAGLVVLPEKKYAKDFADNPDFIKTNRGGVVLVNDNEDSRRMVESCYKRQKVMINPIIDWTDKDVWNFIHAENIPYCGLYDEGQKRIGCIGCPMASTKEREREFARWPKYLKSYLCALQRMLDERRKRHEKNHKFQIWNRAFDPENPTVREVFEWWMEYSILPGQMTFDDFEEGDENA